MLRHRLHAGGVDPAVEEVEQAADHNGIVNGFVGPAGQVQTLDIGDLDGRAVAVDFLDVGQQRFFSFRDGRGAIVFEYGFDLGSILEQFRRDRGVALDSKGAVV